MSRFTGPYEQTLYQGTIAGTTADGLAIACWAAPAGFRTRITAASINGRWNANASGSYMTLSLKDDAGATIASAAFTTTGGTVTSTVSMELSTTLAYLELEAGQEVYLLPEKTGSGQTMSDLRIWIKYELMRLPD